MDIFIALAVLHAERNTDLNENTFKELFKLFMTL